VLTRGGGGEGPVEVEERVGCPAKLDCEVKGSCSLDTCGDTDCQISSFVGRRAVGGGTDREKVTWSISSSSMRTQGLGTKRRYLRSTSDSKVDEIYFSKGYRTPSLALRAHFTPG